MQRVFRTIALVAALAAAAGSAAAQDFVFGWNPRSGDVWVDQRLGDINQYGTRYREPFIDEVTRYYGAPRDLVSDLLDSPALGAGRRVLRLLDRADHRPPVPLRRRRMESRPRPRLGRMAKRLGIKPGSAEFHRLKKGFVPTYDRWSRPIVLDDDLRARFSQPRQGASAGKGNVPRHGQDHGKGKPNSADKSSGKDKGKRQQE